MKKLLSVVLCALMIFTFTSCKKASQDSFPDIFEVLEKGAGLTEKEFEASMGSLGEKEKSYLQHHYGDIYFPYLSTAYPDDAQSYKGTENSVYFLKYKFSPRALFVARSQTDKTKELASVSYSLDKPLNELYYAAKDFHKEILEKYPNATYSEEFDDILFSIDTFTAAFNENKETKHIYTKSSVGVEVGNKTNPSKVEDTGYRNIWVMNYYQDSSFPGKISLSIHSDFGDKSYWHRLNIVYQKETLYLKYNAKTGNELFYKYGDTTDTGFVYYGSGLLFALDF